MEGLFLRPVHRYHRSQSIECVTHVPEQLLPISPVCTTGEGWGEGDAPCCAATPKPPHPNLLPRGEKGQGSLPPNTHRRRERPPTHRRRERPPTHRRRGLPLHTGAGQLCRSGAGRNPSPSLWIHTGAVGAPTKCHSLHQIFARPQAPPSFPALAGVLTRAR